MGSRLSILQVIKKLIKKFGNMDPILSELKDEISTFSDVIDSRSFLEISNLAENVVVTVKSFADGSDVRQHSIVKNLVSKSSGQNK
jgi:hypothetical protein